MTPPVSTDERRPVPAIDPRLRARRIAVLRDVGRRRLHRFRFAAILAGVAAAAIAVALSPLLDVDAIDITGAPRSGRAAVLAASGVDVGEPLLTLDAGGAESGIRALPWVADVRVRRSWPGTVAVDVDERVAVAGIVVAEGAVALVDAGGRVLEAVPAEAAGVVPIAGLAAVGRPGSQVPEAALPAVAVATALPADLRRRVERIVVADGGALHLELRLADGPPALVLLGDASALAEKLVSLATVLVSVDLTGVAVIDVEVPRAPALTRH